MLFSSNEGSFTNCFMQLFKNKDPCDPPSITIVFFSVDKPKARRAVCLSGKLTIIWYFTGYSSITHLSLGKYFCESVKQAIIEVASGAKNCIALPGTASRE